MLKCQLSHKFKKCCKFSSHLKAKSCKRNTYNETYLYVCVLKTAVTCFSTSGPSTGSSLKTVHLYWNMSQLCHQYTYVFNTLRTGDADLRFYITTVQDGWRKSAFLTRACFPCTIDLIMQYVEPVSEWFCWRMFIETWPHSELTFRHHASSI